MLPDRVSNPGPLTYESGALPIALRGPADKQRMKQSNNKIIEIFFSHPKILVAIATKMKIYTHATVL